MSLSRRVKQSMRRGLGLLRRDRPALLGFLFHALYEDEQEIGKHHLSPQQGITITHMRQFIEHFLRAGYRFLPAESDLSKLSPEGRYLCLTFDDGYANNLRMLPLLKEYDIPATFYITTGNVAQQQCFWWDVVHRERHRQGQGHKAISKEQKMLKHKSHDKILEYLRDSFGPNCLRPWSDTDRPMTVEELQAFARHEQVFIGNHTRDHYLMDRYPEPVLLEQLQRAGKDLEQWLGRRPGSLAYPNGSFSTQALEASRKAGFKLAWTLQKHKNRLPIQAGSSAALRLGRFTLWGRNDIDAQCEVFRSDIHL